MPATQLPQRPWVPLSHPDNSRPIGEFSWITRCSHDSLCIINNKMPKYVVSVPTAKNIKKMYLMQFFWYYLTFKMKVTVIDDLLKVASHTLVICRFNITEIQQIWNKLMIWLIICNQTAFVRMILYARNVVSCVSHFFPTHFVVCSCQHKCNLYNVGRSYKFRPDLVIDWSVSKLNSLCTTCCKHFV